MPYEAKYCTRITIELGEAFRGTGTLSLLFQGRTYSPPAKQAVVSLPLVRLVRSPREMRLLRKPMDDATPQRVAVVVHAASKGRNKMFHPYLLLAQTCHRQLCRRYGCIGQTMRPFSLLRKRNRNRRRDSEGEWQSTIWKQR